MTALSLGITHQSWPWAWNVLSSQNMALVQSHLEPSGRTCTRTGSVVDANRRVFFLPFFRPRPFAVLCLMLFAALLFKLESCGVWAAVCSSGWRGFSLYLSSPALPYSLAVFFCFFFTWSPLSLCSFSLLCSFPLWMARLWLCAYRPLEHPISVQPWNQEASELWDLFKIRLRRMWTLYYPPCSADNMAQIWSLLLVYLSAAAFWTSWRVFRELLQQPDDI